VSKREESLERLHQHLEAVVGFAGDPRAHTYIASRIGLSLPRSHAAALWALSDGPRRVGDLAVRLDTDQSNLSRTVTALEEQGLVERVEDPADRRARTVRVTPLGRTTGRRLRQEWTAAMGARLAGWSDADLRQAEQLLGRLTASLRVLPQP
jgi:DNA-binding MarR family transcriptional regulator